MFQFFLVTLKVFSTKTTYESYEQKNNTPALEYFRTLVCLITGTKKHYGRRNLQRHFPNQKHGTTPFHEKHQPIYCIAI